MAINKITMVDVLARAAPPCEICLEPASLAKLTTVPGKKMGEFAHVRSARIDGPRHDSAYPHDKLDDSENLFWACSGCHHLVDTNKEDWPTKKLLEVIIKNRSHGAGVVTLIIDGEIVVAAKASEQVTGIDANGQPTLLRPGTKISVTAENCRSVIGVKN